MDGSSQTTWGVTPAVEVGARLAVGADMVLRSFLSAAGSFLSHGDWQETARLVAAPAGTEPFTTTVNTSSKVANVGAGVQLFIGPRFDLRLQYDGEFSCSTTSHGGSVAAAFRF